MPAALGPGDPAPDFKLFNPFEVEVSLQSALEGHTVHLEFIRGTWDPNSRHRLQEISQLRAELRTRQARSIIVSCEPLADARRHVEQSVDALTLLVDPAHDTARAYAVFERFSFGAFKVAKPASFLIDRCAFIRFAHVGSSPIDVADLSSLIRVVDELRSEEKRGQSGT